MSEQIQNSAVLQHHGILGQRWGVRRTEAQLAKSNRANSEAASARKLATAYTKSIDKRAAKKPDSINRQTDSKNAHALADKYTSSMDKKAAKRAAQAEKTKSKYESPVKKMSDAELRQKINRIQMERQYSQLSKKDISAGQKFVSDVFMNAAKQTATNYAYKYMTKGIDMLIDNITKK